MKNIIINFRQIHLLIISLMIGLIFLLEGHNYHIYGHDFAGDESASFLSMLDQIQVEMNLINSNLIANNQSLARDHLNQLNELYTEDIKKEIAEKNERIANEISSIINETDTTLDKREQKLGIDDLLKNFNDLSEEAISVRIDPAVLTNGTIQALHFADLINAIDDSYATAFDRKPMNMSGMDMGNNGEMMNISNLALFQTAKELTNTVIDLFNSTIKEYIPVNATERTNSIEEGLKQLKEKIGSKHTYDDVTGIIHGIIHTNTQETFGLSFK